MKELSLKQNLLWNTVGCLIYQGCQWLTTIAVVVFSSSYENSGILAFAMATGNVYTGLATYNMRTFQVSDVNNQYSSGNYVAFRFVTIGIATVGCCIYSLCVSPSLNTAIAMLCFLLFKADESFANVLYGVDQKYSRMDFIGISQAIRGVLSIVAFSAMLLLDQNLSISILAMFACCAAVTLLFDIPHSGKLDAIRPTITPAICSTLFRTCAPVVIAILCYGLVATVARQWFGLIQGEEQLGIYAAVATPCVLVQVMANYLYSPFLVPLSRSWVGNDGRAFRQQLKKLCLAMAGCIAVCLALFTLLGPTLLNLAYGSSIGPYAWMITPAMIAASLMAISSFMTDLFIVMRKFACAVSINAIALAACIAAFLPCVSNWGMNGVNIVICVAFVIGIGAGMLLLLKSKR